MTAGEMVVPIAGPSRTPVEEVPCNQGSGTGRKKGKGAAAKKADKALDAPKGDCYHWTCSNPSELSHVVPVAGQRHHRTMTVEVSDVTLWCMSLVPISIFTIVIYCAAIITQTAFTCGRVQLQLTYVLTQRL